MFTHDHHRWTEQIINVSHKYVNHCKMVLDRFWVRSIICDKTCAVRIEFVTLSNLYDHAIYKTVCNTTIGLNGSKVWTLRSIRGRCT